MIKVVHFDYLFLQASESQSLFSQACATKATIIVGTVAGG